MCARVRGYTLCVGAVRAKTVCECALEGIRYICACQWYTVYEVVYGTSALIIGYTVRELVLKGIRYPCAC